MNKEEFKKRWESDESGGGITNQEVADCYINWGLGKTPYIHTINYIIWKVCEAADTEDKEFWKKQADDEQ